MAQHGLEGIDDTVQQTYLWIDEIARRFHGNRHQGLQILRGFLHVLRDHLPVDESAQLAAQLPTLVRGIYYEGWDPTRNLQHERGREEFLTRFIEQSGIRQMDAPDALAAAFRVMAERTAGGESNQVLMLLPPHVRELLTAAAR